MAYNRTNTLEQLETVAQVLYGVKFFRFIFFFYSFLSFAFWFLNCLDVDWLYMFNWLFLIPYQLVGLFYRPEGISIDFSLAIVGILSLIIGFVFDFIVNFIYERILDLQEKEEEKIRQRKLSRKKTIRKPVVSNTDENGVNFYDESKLLFLIMPHVNKIKRKKDDLELTFQEVSIWKQRINKHLLESISYTKPLQKGYYRKNLFLLFRDFNYVDEFVYYTKPTLDSIVLEFKKLGIFVSFCYVLSSVSNIEQLEKELDIMDTILSLNFVNDFIVTSRFRLNYKNKPVHKYSMILKGEYNLSKNLTISNKQELYSLTNVERGE